MPNFYGISKRVPQSQFIKAMRQSPTRSESLLHNALITRFSTVQTQIVHQYPVGPFIADFKIRHFLIEVDGSSHDDRATYDARRDTYIRNKGYSIFRVINDDVIADPAQVADHIFHSTGPHAERKDSPVKVTHCPPSRSFYKPKKPKRQRLYIIGFTGKRS